MLFLFIVAFIVTLIAAVYMQFGSQAERYVLQYKLDADVLFLIGGGVMALLSLQALFNSGMGLYQGYAVFAVSWMPIAFVGVKVERIQRSFHKLYEIGKDLNSKRTKVGMLEHHAVLFFIEMERINNGQNNRVHRAILAHKRYNDYK
jgi:hypothetical protein